jgi:hypothetical protein
MAVPIARAPALIPIDEMSRRLESARILLPNLDGAIITAISRAVKQLLARRIHRTAMYNAAMYEQARIQPALRDA